MCLDMAKNGVFLRLERSEGIVNDLSSRSGDSEKVHVLAVDDSLVDRKVIEGLLKITSFKVTAVESGWRALQFLGLDGDENSVGLDRLKVDMIITDYCMPGMTGYELLKRLRLFTYAPGSSAFRKVPVVIMSSENVLARIHRCLEEGAEDFIVKPVKLSDIKRLKRAVFGSSPNDDDNNNKDTAIVIQTKPDNNSNPGLPRRLPPWQEPPPPLPSPDNTPSSSSLNSPQSDSSSSLSPTSPHSPLALLLKDKDPSKDHPHSPLEIMLLKDKEDDSTLLKEPHSPLEIILLTDPPHSSSPLKILLKEEEEGNDRKPPRILHRTKLVLTEMPLGIPLCQIEPH